jgi:hypothetical protein
MSKPATNRRYHHNHGFLTAASKSTSRHLAALDFLLNIPMANEEKIKETGILNAARIRSAIIEGYHFCAWNCCRMQ